MVVIIIHRHKTIKCNSVILFIGNILVLETDWLGFFLADVFQSPTSTLQKDESLVRVLVRIPNQQVFNEVCLTATVA